MGCGLSGPVVHKIDPEAFFPRCWDVGDDDGFPSMLKAFVVSAAVALLRRAVTTEVISFNTRPWNDSLLLGSRVKKMVERLNVQQRVNYL